MTYCCPKCDSRMVVVTVHDRNWLREECQNCQLVIAYRRRPGRPWPQATPGSSQAVRDAQSGTTTAHQGTQDDTGRHA